MSATARLIVLLSLLCIGFVRSFVPSTFAPFQAIQSSVQTQFVHSFDDFDDFVGDNHNELPESLVQRMESLQKQERQQNNQIQDNWATGNAQSRGLLLPNDASITSLTVDDDNLVWVGRSDGSVLCIQEGEAYVTAFTSQLKILENNWDNNTVQVAEQLVTDSTESPFEILEQRQVAPAPIDHLLVIDSNILWTATADGKLYHGDVEEPVCQVPAAPSLPLLTLAAMEPSMVCTVTTESIHLYSHTGELLSACRCPDADTVWTAATTYQDIIAVGTDLGQVHLYNATELLQKASHGDYACPLPLYSWTVGQDHEITSLHITESTQPNAWTVWCGTQQGALRQYHVWPVNDTWQSWPRLPTQSLPGGRRHAWQVGTTVGQVRTVNPHVVVTAAAHDIVLWNATTGESLYTLTGSGPIAVANDCLVVPMGHTLCWHDFNTPEFDVDEGAEFTDD